MLKNEFLDSASELSHRSNSPVRLKMLSDHQKCLTLASPTGFPAGDAGGVQADSPLTPATSLTLSSLVSIVGEAGTKINSSASACCANELR